MFALILREAPTGLPFPSALIGACRIFIAAVRHSMQISAAGRVHGSSKSCAVTYFLPSELACI